MKKVPHNQSRQPKSKPINNKKKIPLWMVFTVIATATIGGVLWYHYFSEKGAADSTSASSPVNIPTVADNNPLTSLVGRWTRTDSDGAYVIEIKSATADGKLEASYFNPNPIKVGRAEWQNKNGKLVVLVELRDVNYPGSTYTLSFLPKENRMTGNYYQAVEGANFDVEFVPAP